MINAIFKKYLFYEYAVKNNITQDDDKIINFIQKNNNFISEFTPQVPKQPNTFDCGIFLLAYAELFLLEPNYILENISSSQNNLSKWFNYDFGTNNLQFGISISKKMK